MKIGKLYGLVFAERKCPQRTINPGPLATGFAHQQMKFGHAKRRRFKSCLPFQEFGENFGVMDFV